ncbi:MAG TPA: tetratricopeptide repeat protein [Edaphobacter sp.]|nr:tetratricopeptide repeat protein [Edaphobacter sp.]
MAIHPITRALQAALLLSASCLAQTSPTPNPTPPPCPASNQATGKSPDKTSDQTAQTAKPCPPSPAPAAKKPFSAAEQFPFPGESSKPKNPPDSPSPSTPDSPSPASPTTTTPSDAATQHPFPTQPPPKLPGDDSSSSSSSSSSGDDPNPTPTDDPTAKGDPSNPPEGTSVHRKLPKVKRVQTDDERVDEDLSVAKFYMRDENYQGAYLRAKDAISIQPEYSAAHFALAEILQKMKKKDEAIAEFQTYLKLDPDGEKAKAAKKALAELQ